MDARSDMVDEPFSIEDLVGAALLDLVLEDDVDEHAHPWPQPPQLRPVPSSDEGGSGRLRVVVVDADVLAARAGLRVGESGRLDVVASEAGGKSARLTLVCGWARGVLRIRSTGGDPLVSPTGQPFRVGEWLGVAAHDDDFAVEVVAETLRFR